jgi:hypothetical protein
MAKTLPFTRSPDGLARGRKGVAGPALKSREPEVRKRKAASVVVDGWVGELLALEHDVGVMRHGIVRLEVEVAQH